MKKEIICLDCQKKLERMNLNFPNEKVIWKKGIASTGYLCDLCGTEIKEGSLCVAESIFRIDREKYIPWENEHIK